MELPGYSLQFKWYEQKGQQGEVGAADHQPKDSFIQLLGQEDTGCESNRRHWRDVLPSTASSCFPSSPGLGQEGRPGARWSLVGQDPVPRIQCSDMPVSPAPHLPLPLCPSTSPLWQSCAFLWSYSLCRTDIICC